MGIWDQYRPLVYTVSRWEDCAGGTHTSGQRSAIELEHGGLVSAAVASSDSERVLVAHDGTAVPSVEKMWRTRQTSFVGNLI